MLCDESLDECEQRGGAYRSEDDLVLRPTDQEWYHLGDNELLERFQGIVVRLTLESRGMYRMEAFEKLLVSLAQFIIETILTNPCSVSSDWWMLFHPEHRVRRWIDLKRCIGMPPGLRPWSPHHVLSVVLRISLNHEMSDPFLSWMLVEDSKMIKYLHLLIRCEILITEENDTTFRDKESQFVQLLLIQLR